MTSAPARRPSRPDRLIALVVGAVAVAGWVLAELDSDHLGLPIAVVFGAFLVGSVASSVLRSVTQPGGLSTTAAAFGRTGRYANGAAELSAPRRPMWLLPLAVVPVMAATLPIGFHETPGDWSIVGVMVLIALGFGYAGVALGFVVWLLLVLPSALLVRSVRRTIHGQPATRGERLATWIAALLLTVALLATADELAFRPHGPHRARVDRSLHLPELVGFGDQTSPWWWVARAAVLALVVEVVAIRRFPGTRRRPRADDPVS